MSTVLELHRKAMEYVDTALIARHDLKPELAKKYYYEALQYERKAAEMVANDIDNEPTRSVLHRSAASMAINCGELQEAERLIANALKGNPPQEIALELTDLLEQINSQSNLEEQPYEKELPGSIEQRNVGSYEKKPLVIDRYQIIDRLGQGGMGEVWLAKDTELGRLVAMKYLLPKYLSNQQAMKLFVGEARTLAKIDHHNICSIYDIGQEDARSYIVMPYIKRETLRAYIERMKAGPKNLMECLSIAIQMVKGVNAAHKLGMIHRGIKPENIMISEDGTVKVMDFGLVKLVQREFSAQSGLIGTIPYMSPEQVIEEKNLDDRSDIFSMGIILYEMFTGGRHPFIGDTGLATMKAIEKRNPPPLKKFWSETPSSLQQIVNKALKKNKELRYQSSEELLKDLEKLQQDLKSERVKKSWIWRIFISRKG